MTSPAWTQRRPRSGDDQGLTLIELLISMVVLLIIIVPLTASFVLGVGTASGSTQDATNSTDAQLLAAYFDADVASAETVSTTSQACGGSGTVLELDWKDGAVPTAVAYREVADPLAQTQLNTAAGISRLDRVVCSNGSPTGTTVMARSLLTTGGLTLTCNGQSVSASACPATPRTVSLALVEYGPQFSDSGATGRYSFGVSAVREVTP